MSISFVFLRLVPFGTRSGKMTVQHILRIPQKIDVTNHRRWPVVVVVVMTIETNLVSDVIAIDFGERVQRFDVVPIGRLQRRDQSQLFFQVLDSFVHFAFDERFARIAQQRQAIQAIDRLRRYGRMRTIRFGRQVSNRPRRRRRKRFSSRTEETPRQKTNHHHHQGHRIRAR